MSGQQGSLLKQLGECSLADKQALLAELLREIATEQGEKEVVRITGQAGVLGYFLPVEDRPLPEEGTPEFLTELRRRASSAGPSLPVASLLEFLESQPSKR